MMSGSASGADKPPGGGGAPPPPHSPSMPPPQSPSPGMRPTPTSSPMHQQQSGPVRLNLLYIIFWAQDDCILTYTCVCCLFGSRATCRSSRTPSTKWKSAACRTILATTKPDNCIIICRLEAEPVDRHLQEDHPVGDPCPTLPRLVPQELHRQEV